MDETNAKSGCDLSSLSKYRPYPAYKDSGVEWLGEIPAHWEVRRLKHVAPTHIGKLDKKPGDAVYVGLENVESWTGRLMLEVQPDTIDSVVATFRMGDVLLGKLRPNLAKTGRPDFDGVCTSELLPLRPTAAVSQGYLMYCFLNASHVHWLNSFTYGTKMPRVSPAQVGGSFVQVPPIREQGAIAAFLDRETARIDALMVKKERLMQLLQEKRAALISAVVTGKLQVIKDEGGDSPFILQPSSFRMKASGIEWIGEIPAHWEVKRLWHLTPSRRRIMYGIVLPGPHVDDGVPIVKGGDVSPERLRVDCLNRTTREIEAGYVKSRLQGGDLVYAIRGSIGEVAMVPDELTGANLTQDAARVAYTSVSYGPWLLHALKSKAVFAQLEAGALGATIRGINIRDLKRALLAVPPPVEQRAIAAFLDRETARIDALLAKVREAVERLKELRVALISADVTGKIDVREGRAMKPMTIRDCKEYEAALARIDELMTARCDTPDGDELDALVTRVEQYEQEHFPIAAPDPVEAIRFRKEQAGPAISRREARSADH